MMALKQINKIKPEEVQRCDLETGKADRYYSEFQGWSKETPINYQTRKWTWYSPSIYRQIWGGVYLFWEKKAVVKATETFESQYKVTWDAHMKLS